MEVVPVPPAELARCLSGAPGSKERFGCGASEVLALSRLIAAADASWERGTIQDFQKEQGLNPQVWGKLVAIARSDALESIPKGMRPASYTALYALVVMTADELAAALGEGVLRGDASSRSILEWTKAYRLRGTGIGQEVPLTLLLNEDFSPQQREQLLCALQETAAAFDAEVLEGKGGVRQVDLKAEQRKQRAQEIETKLVGLLEPAIQRASEDLKRTFDVWTAKDLASGKRDVFTGFLQVLGNRVQDEFWRNYGRAYCIKIARDFNMTEKRAERYQLKKRLEEIEGKWGDGNQDLATAVQDVRRSYLQ
jgi:hypothetical protein